MKITRTPDERFVGLPDFAFEAHYAEVPSGDGGVLRVHYLDEGPSDAAPILLLHGEPSWCFLYRHMIPELLAAGHRVIAPDLVGFGKSDKPTDPALFSYAAHVAWMQALIFDVLNLQDITLFGQDWGGLIGLRLLTAEPDRFSRVVIGNTGLPAGSDETKLAEGFLAWREYARTVEVFDPGVIVNLGCLSELDEATIAAYNAPFHDAGSLAAARIFPTLVPASASDPAHEDQLRAWEVLRSFEKPFLCAFSDSDPVTVGTDKKFRREVPGAKDQEHCTIVGAGHFLQEDQGPQLAKVINHFIEVTR
ncbi:MAG: haloalkane dehalogenase [Actinomycetes bacterium]